MQTGPGKPGPFCCTAPRIRLEIIPGKGYIMGHVYESAADNQADEPQGPGSGLLYNRCTKEIAKPISFAFSASYSERE
jgi:hypothetical protein